MITVDQFVLQVEDQDAVSSPSSSSSFSVPQTSSLASTSAAAVVNPTPPQTPVGLIVGGLAAVAFIVAFRLLLWRRKHQAKQNDRIQRGPSRSFLHPLPLRLPRSILALQSFLPARRLQIVAVDERRMRGRCRLIIMRTMMIRLHCLPSMTRCSGGLLEIGLRERCLPFLRCRRRIDFFFLLRFYFESIHFLLTSYTRSINT